MPSPHVDEDTRPLFSLPPEVTANIFASLPCFSDVFALAATCRQLRHVWTTSVIPIYDSMAQSAIACERDARRFLVDQRGPQFESPITAEAVSQMIRNASIVEQATLKFERDYAWRASSKFTFEAPVVDNSLTPNLTAGPESAGEWYGTRIGKHPPTLTSTERIRFIRTYYSFWGLMILDPAEWGPRLETMTSQQVYHLQEIAELNQSIGNEDDVQHRTPSTKPRPKSHFEDVEPSLKRIELQNKVRERKHCLSRRFFQDDANEIISYSLEHGAIRFVAIWDHWQPSLKDMIFHLQDGRLQPHPEENKQYLWDDNYDKDP